MIVTLSRIEEFTQKVAERFLGVLRSMSVDCEVSDKVAGANSSLRREFVSLESIELQPDENLAALDKVIERLALAVQYESRTAGASGSVVFLRQELPRPTDIACYSPPLRFVRFFDPVPSVMVNTIDVRFEVKRAH